MKKLLTFWLVLYSFTGYAQVTDDFSDGDFTANPAWSGDNSEYTITSQQLNSMGPAANGVLYLSTSNAQIDNATWEFWLALQFSPSSSNKTRVYLVSDQSNLENSLNGYFIQIGESGDDEIRFYRQDVDDTETLLFTGSTSFSTNITVRIQVVRDDAANWQVNADAIGGTNFQSEGSQFTDNTYTSTSFFGFVSTHSSTRKDLFFYDDISITAAVAAFSITTITKEGSNGIRIFFNQDADQTSAENTANYSLDFGFGNPVSAARDAVNLNEVLVTFSNAFANNAYTLNINNINNLALDDTIVDEDQVLDVEVQTSFRNIVINEIFADPTPVIGMPGEEFLELFNATLQTINIGDFDLSGGTIPDFGLAPDSYVILTKTTTVVDFQPFGDVVGVTSWNTLTNGGETLVLTDNLGNLVDSISYELDWYQDDAKDDGGYTLEQIRPGLLCNHAANWSASNDVSGGTPGAENSIFDNTPDTQAPNLVDFRAVDQNRFVLTFDEPMDEASLANGSYTFDQGISENGISPQSPGFFSVLVDTDQGLVNETTYTVTVTGVTDCTGNALGTNSLPHIYDVVPPELDRIIVVSLNQIDLLFDEALEETAAETESNFNADNSLGEPSSAQLDDENKARVALVFDSEFVTGIENTLTISTLADQSGNALSAPIETNFTFAQSIDTVIVISINQLEIHFKDAPEMASALTIANYEVDDEVGYPVSAFLDQQDSKIVNLVFDQNFDDNKSLTLTIEDIKDQLGQFISTPQLDFTFDTSPPKVDNVVVLSANTLAVTFDEKVDKASAESLEKYEYEEGNPASITLANDSLTTTLTFAENFESEIIFELVVEKVVDLSGNEMKTKARLDFVYDVSAPEFDHATVLSPKEIVLFFNEGVEEFLAETSANYEVGATLINPVSAQLNLEFTNQVLLTFASDIENAADIPLLIKNLEDQRDNALTADISATLDNADFTIGEAVAADGQTVLIAFNRDLDAVAATDPANYLLNGSIIPTAAALEQDFQVKLTIDDFFANKTLHTLNLSNITDTNAQSLTGDDTNFFLDSRLQMLRMIGDKTLEMTFEVELMNAGFGIVDFSVSNGVGNPLVVVLDQEQPELLRLTFENAFLPDTEYRLSWQNLTNIFENDLTDYFIEFTKDEMPPVLLSAEAVTGQTLEVFFSEPLDQGSAEIVFNYVVDQSVGSPETAVLNPSDSSVLLSFENPFQENIAYTVTANGVKDLSENQTVNASTTFDFTALYVPMPGDLIITEIMADPTPVVGLPDEEYLEIFNNSNQVIDLSQAILSDASGAVVLNGLLPPGEYAIMTGAADGFDTAILAFQVSSLPSFSNGGDSIALGNIDGDLLDFIAYDDSWYRSSSKDDGGYSLERITFGEKCLPQLNWIASENPDGGTPGAENSVKDMVFDTTAPEIITYILTGDSQLSIVFNEPMDENTLVVGNFSIDNGVAIASIGGLGPGTQAIQINFQNPIQEGITYVFSVTVNITDCAGNQIVPVTITFGNGATPQFNDLIITEIMADPEPVVNNLPNTEYLEIYNPTQKTIRLDGLTLRDASNTATLNVGTIAPNEYLLLVPNASVDLFNAIAVMGVSNWPSLANAGETLSIYEGENLVFNTNYSKDWYKDSDKSAGGWSLEMIDVNNPCGEINNWTASQAADGGTPGLANSVSMSNPDNFGSQLIEGFAIDPNTISLVFNEKLFPTDYNENFFTITPDRGFGSASLDEPISLQLDLVLADPLEARQVYTMEVNNVSDCLGNLITDEFNSIEIVLPETGDSLDLIINEVLFNPRSGGVDFVEIYNNSDKHVDLQNWRLANVGSDGKLNLKTIVEAPMIISPGEYRAFTSNATILKAGYPSGNEQVFVALPSFPSFNDDDGTVVLLDDQERIIDWFEYNEDFHFSLIDDVEGVSLERISFDAPTNTSNTWQSASSAAGFATPGLKNSQAKSSENSAGTVTIQPKVFVPDNTGQNDFTTINYKLENPGNFANVNVFNTNGVLVKTLAEGQLLSTTGFMTWDGTTNDGRIATVGYYIVFFEVFDTSGNKKVIKETVVLGTRF